MLSRFLASCLGVRITDQAKSPAMILEAHSDQSRFKGTKVYLESPTVSPDYKIVARIDHTENGGNEIYLTWTDVNGVKSGLYRLKPEDRISIIGIKDAHSLNVKPTAPEVIKAIKIDRSTVKEISTEKKPTLLKIVSILRNEGIEHHSVGSTIVFGAKKYYIEYVEGLFEIGNFKRGILRTFKDNSDGVRLLIKKVKNIDSSIDFEKELEKIR